MPLPKNKPSITVIRWAIFSIIALFAFAVRVPQLGERPMHTDEAVNAYITGELLAGGSFHYSPQDGHGPALFALAEPVTRLLGAKNFSELTETELRFTPVLIGSAAVLLFGTGVELFGFTACLIAALLFAFAPLSVYYSRYFIHETLFVAATFGLMVSGGRTLKSCSLWSAALAGLCAALMLACKETAVIHFFALVVVAAGYWWWHGRTVRAGWLKAGGIALVVFVVTTVLLFSWFGQHWSGLSDLFRAVPRFAARAGGEGHAKPFSYYFGLLDPMFIWSILAAAGIYAAIFDAVTGVRKAGVLLAIYGTVVFLIYSFIPYKTPWLALNLWLPLALLCGFGTTALWEQMKTPAWRWGAVVAGGLLLMTLATQTQTLVFDKPVDERNPYAYAHTGEDLLRLPVRLEELAGKIPNPRIAVVAADAWPLPWYLRKFSQAGFWQPGQAPGAADFFVTTTDVPDDLTERLKGFRPEFFGVRPNVLLILWVPSSAYPATETSPPPAATRMP